MLIFKPSGINNLALSIQLIVDFIHNQSILPQFWILAMCFPVKLDKLLITRNVVDLFNRPCCIDRLESLTDEINVRIIGSQYESWELITSVMNCSSFLKHSRLNKKIDVSLQDCMEIMEEEVRVTVRRKATAV